MEKMDMRKIRDDFRKELALCDGQLDRLYAEMSNRFAAMSLVSSSHNEAEMQRLDLLLSIAEGELAAAYLQEHGWTLGKFWTKGDKP